MSLLFSRRAALLGACALTASAASAQTAPRDPYATAASRAWTDAQWRARLSPAAYQVLRHEGTERPFTSPLNEEHRAGAFACAGCALPLFRSAWKFDSGTGWPSFYRAMDGAIGQKIDRTHGMTRTEYHCARCLGHQGHIFEDGPAPTGLRHCNNGVALSFTPA